WQMIVGGACMTVFGLWSGEVALLSPDSITLVAVYSFLHLLVFGSLVGFIAYNWLLGHVSAASAGTSAYVNPLIAVIVGWLLASESLSIFLGLGMVIILTGVALVRLGATSPKKRTITPHAIHWETPQIACEPEQVA